MAVKGEKVEVDPKSFVIQDGRLLLFYKDLFTDTRKDWLKKQAEYLPKADASWKKLSGESPRTPEARAQQTLQAQLDAKRAEFEAKASPEQLAVYNKGVEDVAASSVMQTALRVGAKAPDFELPNATGQRVKLADLLKQGPVVLTWYRGGWCPYCNIQLHAYQEVLADIESAGGKLVAISPELPDQSLSTREKNALKFEVLSDSGNAVARSYGLAYRLPDDLIARFKGRLDLPKFNGDESWELPLGATYVVARDGTITYAFVDADYRKRAEPAAIVVAVKAAARVAPMQRP
jgi:peroxiredoxin